MTIIYTSSVREEFSSEEILVLDTTMKTGRGVGALMAPTKDMVYGHKYKGMTNFEYHQQYHALLNERWKADPEPFQKLKEHKYIALQCYCAHDEFCHRKLLRDWLINTVYGFRYAGEVINKRVRRVIVSGSRDCSFQLFDKMVDVLLTHVDNGWRLVCGDAPGIDLNARRLYTSNRFIYEVWFPELLKRRYDDLPVEYMQYHAVPPNTHKESAASQYITRDHAMVKSYKPRDIFLAFWNGKSKGTHHTFRAAANTPMSCCVYVEGENGISEVRSHKEILAL